MEENDGYEFSLLDRAQFYRHVMKKGFADFRLPVVMDLRNLIDDNSRQC